jgi:hypothetical protein
MARRFLLLFDVLKLVAVLTRLQHRQQRNIQDRRRCYPMTIYPASFLFLSQVLLIAQTI